MATNTKKLKSLLHESIENIDDEGFLRTVKDILDQKYEPQKDIQPRCIRKSALPKLKKTSIQEISSQMNKLMNSCPNG